MASSYPNLCYCCSASIPKIPSTTHYPSSLYLSTSCGYNGISLHRTLSSNSRTYAKFDKFQGEASQDNLEEITESPSLGSQQQTIQEVEEEDDRWIWVNGHILHIYILCLFMGFASSGGRIQNMEEFEFGYLN